MSASKILLFLCLAFIAGVFVESVFEIPQKVVWGFLIVGALIILFSLANLIFFRFATCSWVPRISGCPRLKKINWLAFGFCLLFFVLGIFRMQISEFNVKNNKLIWLNNKGEVIFVGTVINDPEIKSSSQNLKVKAFGSVVLITTERYPEYKYLDKLEIKGKLDEPQDPENAMRKGSYKNYLAKDDIYSVMGFPKIKVVGKEKFNIASYAYSKILFLKEKFRENINKNFSPPKNLILQGLVLGDRASISQELKNKFNVTGTSHIIAVSGTHIVILTSILMALLLSAGLFRQQAFYVSVIFICFYVVLVGLPASGVRSAIMAILFLLGQQFGRQTSSSRIIVIACTLMLLQNPMLLIYDIGFQLSFLAVLGLIYLEPAIRYFVKIFLKIIFKTDIKDKYDGYIMLFSATVSAQVFTMPVIVYNFGNVSFISPLANLLILPVVYLLMLFGFASVFLGVIFFWLGWLVAVPCHFLLSYFIFIVEVLSKEWAYKIIYNIHWVWLAFSYIFLSAGVWFLNKKNV
jgi:competence protein ComEC